MDEYKLAEAYVEFTTRGAAGVEQQMEQVNRKAKRTSGTKGSTEGKQPAAPSEKNKSADGKQPAAPSEKNKSADGLFGSGGGGSLAAVAKVGAAIGAAVSGYLATVKAGVQLASPQTLEKLNYEFDRLLAIVGQHAIPLFEGLAKQARKSADKLDYFINSNDLWGKKLEAMFTGVPQSNKELNIGKWSDLIGMRDRLQEQALRGIGEDRESKKREEASTAIGRFVDAVDGYRRKLNEQAPILKWLAPPGINPLDPTGLEKFSGTSRMMNEG
jgi:hypothetical protein